jgi:hypothetical protein
MLRSVMLSGIAGLALLQACAVGTSSDMNASGASQSGPNASNGPSGGTNGSTSASRGSTGAGSSAFTSDSSRLISGSSASVTSGSASVTSGSASVTSGSSGSSTHVSSGSSSRVSSGSSSRVTSSSSGSTSVATGDAGCVDECPAPNAGVTFACEKRFLFGVNYAWKNWGADFGGGSSGVAGDSAAVKADLADMQSHGVDVIRWWMFQEFNGTGPALDGSGIPTGEASGTVVADIQAALAVAKQIGVHYNFTLFSFDNFTINSSNHDLGKVITNSGNLAKLEAFVALVAKTVEQDANRDRVVSWDVINEPEWAIDGSSTDPYGDGAFGGSSGGSTDVVTFSTMETFVRQTVTTLHANSSALVTVGSAAIKWKEAWQHVGLDYTTVHMYDWINQWYPYNTPVSTFGLSTPVVLGEFPNSGLSAVSAGTGVWNNGAAAVPYGAMVSTIFGPAVGYAGAMSWAVTDTAAGAWSTAKSAVATFASSEPCVTAY